MTEQTVFANARPILNAGIVTGSVAIKDAVITTISSSSAVWTGSIDLEGDYLAPGLVELHTDNLERHLSPRPKVDWPYRPAILTHDRELAGIGITTVYDAIRVGSILSGESARYGKYARRMADEIFAMRAAGICGSATTFICRPKSVWKP